MSQQKIRFANRDLSGFIPEVKAEVNQYFKDRDLSKHANWRMIRNGVVVLLMTFGSYALIISGQFTLMQMWLLTFVMGVGAAGVGFGVAHDALHSPLHSARDFCSSPLGLVQS